MHSGNQPPRKAYMHSFKPPRRVGRWAPLAAAIMSSAFVAGPLAAQAGAAVTAFELTYNTGAVLTDAATDVTVSRLGTLATGKALDVTGGEFAINDAAIATEIVAGDLVGATMGCWTGYTPQILPGDTVTYDGGSVTIPDLTAEKPVVEGNSIVVRGTAVGGDLASVSVQLFPGAGAIKFTDGKQFWDTSKAVDPSKTALAQSITMNGSSFTARFSNMNPQDFQAAAAGTAVVTQDMLAAAADPADPAAVVPEALVHYEAGATPAGVGGCPAYAPNEAKSVSRSLINSNSADLLVSGVAQPNATASTVTLTDSAGHIVTAPAVGGAAWTATVPAAQLQSLSDGPISIGSAYSIGKGATVKGLLSKDATAPSAPTASVAAGQYTSTQNVALSSNDGTIRYTTDGSDPTSSSKAYSKAIPVSSSTTIKAVAIDAAGNMSDVSSFGYQIVAAAAPAPIKVIAPSAPKLKLDALTLGSRHKLKTVRKRGFSMVVFAPEGAKFVRVRLLRNGKLITRVIRKVSSDGVMTITLPTTKSGRRHLKRGTYKVQVAPGTSASKFGTTTTRTVRIR